MDLQAVVESFVELVASRVAEKIGAPRAPERIPLDRCREFGAPSARWVQAKARDGLIELRGPRGGRYVGAGELASLLASATINRRAGEQTSGVDVAGDVRDTVAALATRRVRGGT